MSSQINNQNQNYEALCTQWEQFSLADPSPEKIIKNAHDDDIHGLISLSNTDFVSGSKDQSLKRWTAEGDLTRSQNLY